MSQIKIDSKDITEIRKALQVIQRNAVIIGQPDTPFHLLRHQITEQVERISKLLPKEAKGKVLSMYPQRSVDHTRKELEEARDGSG